MTRKELDCERFGQFSLKALSLFQSLFTTVDEAAWQISTIPLFRALFDNYDEAEYWMKRAFLAQLLG